MWVWAAIILLKSTIICFHSHSRAVRAGVEFTSHLFVLRFIISQQVVTELLSSGAARPDWQPNAALLVWQRLNAAEERKTDFTAVRMLLALFLQHSAEPVQRLINRDALVTLNISLLVKCTEIVAQWFFMPANSQQVEKEDECFKLAPPQSCSRLWF